MVCYFFLLFYVFAKYISCFSPLEHELLLRTVTTTTECTVTDILTRAAFALSQIIPGDAETAALIALMEADNKKRASAVPSHASSDVPLAQSANEEQPARSRFAVIDEFFVLPKPDTLPESSAGPSNRNAENRRGKETNSRSAGPSTSTKTATSASQGKKITVWVGDSDSN